MRITIDEGFYWTVTSVPTRERACTLSQVVDPEGNTYVVLSVIEPNGKVEMAFSKEEWMKMISRPPVDVKEVSGSA